MTPASEDIRPAPADTFPAHSGLMSERVRLFDWSATPLGPIAGWPSCLRIACDMILASHFPKALVWGPRRITLYNDAFRPILGQKAEALGRPFDDVWSEAWDTLAPVVDRAFDGEATYIEDFALPVNRSGFVEEAFFTFCYSPVRDEAGVVRGMVDTVIETTGKVAAQRQLAQYADGLSREVADRTEDRDRLWRLSTDLMAVLDTDGRLAAANPAWTGVLGWPAAQLVGDALDGLLHPDDRDTVLIALERLRGDVATVRFECRLKHRESGWHLLLWTAVADDGCVHLVGRDMTAERDASEALKRSEAALYQSQKMESVGQLTGGVAHDFNNLLQVVSGNLQLLGRMVAGQERGEKHIANAMAAVSRGAKLTSQLLAFARRQPLEPKVVNIGRFVTGMDDLLRHSLGETIEVETVVAGGLWNTLVDPSQVENALLNLAINARDAMGGVGRLTIEAGNAMLDDDYTRHHPELESGQYVMLAVTDTGSGMPPEVLAKVFEPFFTTKPEGKGTGLGLSMVYGFVRQSGGHVKLYSELGQGTTVKLYLPRAMQAEDVVVAERARPVVGGEETILVAEDDDEVRATVVEMLERLGYRVLQARDPASALAIIESGIAIDLLFTDVVMPGTMRSPELARRARERLPGIAVLFTSGYTQNAIVHGGRLDAGVELLGKPYTQDALALRVRKLLDQRLLARSEA
ncbi:PAS domain-containing sensor histidine kinase [Xylophilus sp. GOD-11R]|uniref:hybrid sensor histidine kinase/response regulator n=1 Tax=Xylophilus sp. GOD-11R TaxID=3089814 RepID=UPI00298CEB84|nr:ATP-binding protein [Xylophilus sp. GOD-11R]WPB55720.1 ATP-binding protein [Xylophilus sp. GOD-11R]